MIRNIKAKTDLKILTCKGMVLIDVDSIIRIEAISNYSKIFFNDGKTLVVAKVLRWFEEKLAYECFIRIHRTHIVNKTFIRDYTIGTIRPERGGKVYLENGDCIDVAKRKRTYFLKSWYRPTA